MELKAKPSPELPTLGEQPDSHRPRSAVQCDDRRQEIGNRTPHPHPGRSLRSCLYECSVMHHRLEPKQHHFRYRIFMLALDLDELDTVAARVKGFSRNRWNLYTFRDDDHLKTTDAPPASLRDKFTSWLTGQGTPLPEDARITLLTLPRVLGYIFNPVSFYFCEDASGTPLCAVVEVGNTFREMKLYLLREPTSQHSFRLTAPKHFYVSPFAALDLSFDFKLRVPDENLDIHIDDYDGDRPILLSALTGRRAPLSTMRLWWFTLKYPLITLKVIGLIHWHALLLWMRRVPWHRKADDHGLQQDVLHPHASLTRKTP